MSLNRRNFIAGSAALASAPALGAVSASGEVDVAIIGAGAAGIAAARKVAAAGRRFVLLEASDRIGGRCLTDTRTFGVPYDRGAHWLHMPEINPVAKLARAVRLRGLSGAAGPEAAHRRRNAREGEMEDYLAARRAREPRDPGCARAARPTSAACRRCRRIWATGGRRSSSSLGPFGCGKNLDGDLGDGFRALGRARRRFVLPPGARRAAGEARRRAAGAARDAGDAHAVDAQFRRDRDRRAAASRRAPRSSRCRPPCSPPTRSSSCRRCRKRQLDAIAKLSLGSYDHVALELKGNPLQLRNDDLVFEKATGARTAALLANVSGTPLCDDRDRRQVRRRAVAEAARPR